MNWTPKKFHYKVILNYRINEKKETLLVRELQEFCWWWCRGAKAWLDLTWVISCCRDGWNHKPTLGENSATGKRCWETTLCYRLVKGCTLITESHLGLKLTRCCGAGHSGYRLKNSYQSQTPDFESSLSSGKLFPVTLSVIYTSRQQKEQCTGHGFITHLPCFFLPLQNQGP